MTGDLNLNGGLTLVPMPGFKPMADEIKRRLGYKKSAPPVEVDIAVPNFGKRISGEPFLQLGKNHIGGHDCVVLASGPGIPEMLIQLQILLGYLAARRARRIAILFGYLPLSRSDKDEGECELALFSFFVHMLVSAANGRLDRIIAPDSHAEQGVMAGNMGLVTQVSLIRRVIKMAMDDATGGKICLMLPDDGAMKRYEAVINEVCPGVPIVCGRKRRENSAESKSLGLFGDTDWINGSLVIGVDDEIATGGTNINTARAVISDYDAAEYWAVAVHGVLCGKAPIVFAQPGPVSRIYIANTIPVETRTDLAALPPGFMRVYNWGDDAANLIYHHHTDQSLRALR
jgi:phosphoribosylpyrophosphate synthetase